MEQWGAVIDACPTQPDLRFFSKAVQTAGVVFKEDLAHFEKEWILQTLLYEPINLIAVVSTKRADDGWSKALGDAFKRLADLTDDHSQDVEPHFEEIVKACLLTFDAQTRIQALQCLTSIAAVSSCGAKDVARHIAQLEDSSSGKAPTALLIGTICEHHPETVEKDINKIWRLFLNLLDSNKNTDRITDCLLKGVLGLFKHFGTDLPTAELGEFYEKLVTNYIRIGKCEEVCLKILTDHANLFRERMSKDVRIRNYLWNYLHNCTGTGPTVNGVQAIMSVYISICGCLSKEQLQRIVTTELLPQTLSLRTQVKYTALRILTYIQTYCHISIQADGQTDSQALEIELREGSVSYDVANKLSWYLESRLPGSDNLLQTAMVFYENLPDNKRKEIVVHGILNATDELRSAAIKFLITESTQNAASLEAHQTLWADLFDTDNGKDYVVVDKSRMVFEDFMSYAIFVLEGFLEDCVETLPEKLILLLQLTSQVLSCPREHYTNDYCIVLLPLLTQLLKLSPDAVTMSAARCAIDHIADPNDHVDILKEFYQVIRIDRCKDEALLCESCLALIQADTDAVHINNVLMALQITFSRNDVEPQVLSKALQKLEKMIVSEKDKLNSGFFNNIIHCVEKLHHRKDLAGKDGRILHRNVLMFLGKYGNRSEVNNNTDDNTMIVKLMESLTLNIVNPDEGTSYKLNLQRILQLALEQEERNSLQTLLIIICANLATKKEECLQLALTRVCVALASSHARGASVDPRALQAAVAMCDTANCVQGLLKYISLAASPGVRKMLSDALETLLAADQEDTLSSVAAEHVNVLMNSMESTKKRAGLNITDTLIASLKDNNALTKTLLPDLLTTISKTFEIDSETTFEIGSKHFLDKIELFEQNVIDELFKKLLEILLLKRENLPINRMTELDVKIFKNTTKMILDFVKNVIEYKKENGSKLWEIIFEIIRNDSCDFEKSLFVSAKFKSIFGFAFDLDGEFLNQLFLMEITLEEPYFKMEAVLMFLQEYADNLLDLHYQTTLQFLGKILTELTPQCIKHLHRNVKSCLSVYTKKSTPSWLLTSFEKWCSRLPLSEITIIIEKEVFATEHSIMVFALKIMLQIFDPKPLVDLKITVQKWSKILLKLYANGYITKHLKSKMSYLTDILTVSLKFTNLTDVKKLILEGSTLDGLSTEKVGVQYCRFFMHVFYEILVEKPYILLDDDMKQCSILLNDVVRFTLKKRCTDEQYDTVLELVVKLWKMYEIEATFNQKHSLLLDLSQYPRKMAADSNPMRWAVHNVIYSEASREERARLIGVLPGGDSYSEAYRSFASTLPTRLSELKGECGASLRALLDALASTGDLTLLNIVITLAGGDDTSGWWDDAISACMAGLAQRGDLNLCKAVYTRSRDGLSTGVCRRMLLPLLRYSSSKLNEDFFSSILNDLLSVKTQEPSNHPTYHKRIVDYTRVCSILQLAFEKIPAQSLESPNSQLYKGIDLFKFKSQSWHIVRQTCTICNTLRAVKLPENADEKFREDYRQFQCANYNCITAAICKRRPDKDTFYKLLFGVTVFDSIVDSDKEYQLWIRQQWNQRTSRQPVSIAVESAPSSGLASLSASVGTVRSRMFLRTLSENPLMYDLIEDSTNEEIQTQDIQLPSSELNSHECSATLTALLCHVITLPHTSWRDLLIEGLKQCKKNAKWLLAQVICNCKEELKPHASALRPVLLELVSSTAIEMNGKKVFNGLHIDILETIIHWVEESPLPSQTLDSCMELLITTCLEQRKHKAIYRTLIEVLTKFLGLYASVVNVTLSVFEPYLADPETPKTLQILQRVTKSKVYIPSLLPTLLKKLEDKQYYQLSVIAELIGLALSACRERQPFLIRFRKVLDGVRRTNAAEYIKMLYYAQSGCAEVCDEYNFRMTTSLSQEVTGHEKTKSLRILATFVSTSNSQYVQELFETIDLAELLTEENIEAFNLVKEGVHKMSDHVKRRVLLVVAGYCEHAMTTIRRAANEVMIKAFEDIFSRPDESSAKKLKTSITPLISKILSKDVYVTTILNALSYGMIDKDAGISAMVREGIAKMLHKDMGIRFAECFFLTVYLPALSNNNNKAQNLSVCVSALLEMLLMDLMSQERFKRIKLRDEPLELRLDTSCSKLVTMSRSYQGTFRRRSNLTKRHLTLLQANSDQRSSPIDVQITIENILNTFVQFSKDTPETSKAFCLQLISAIAPLDLAAEVAKALAAILDRGVNELTPFVVDLCRVFLDDLCKVGGIEATLQKLHSSTKNTEGDHITRLLLQNVRLRCAGNDQFVLGTVEDDSDVAMEIDDGTTEFSIEDLVSAFGKLSNWDTLTVQQKRNIQNNGLPQLWTDKDTFKQLLDNYTPSTDWFGKMAAAYRQVQKRDVIKWLREMDKWPRRHFHISAITEAIEWQERRESNSHPCDILPAECLAEWAARLMIRSAYQSSLPLPEPNGSKDSTSSHELQWCERASDAQLGSLILDCVNRNIPNITYEKETLPWLRQKVCALRHIGLKTRDQEILNKALTTAEKYTQRFIKHTAPEVVVSMAELILRLNTDLNSLSKDKLDDIYNIIDSTNGRIEDGKNKQNITNVYELGMTYYDDQWDNAATELDQNAILSDMIYILTRCKEHNIFDEGLFAIVLNKLDDYKGSNLQDNVGRKLMDLIQLYKPLLNEFTLELLSRRSSLLPSYSHLFNQDAEEAVQRYKRCFQLICDAGYLLLQYCSELRNALKNNDEDQWEAIFKKLKDRLFDNPYAGSDYQLLNRYKSKLYEICEYDMSPTFKASAEKILKDIGRVLNQRPAVSVLRLSQLCPALSHCQDCGTLLGLRHTQTVVRIHEQVQVFNSIRRPALLKVLLSDGTFRRYLHKSGEPLAVDAAAQTVLRYTGHLFRGKCPVVTYNVTPLSEDCGLIEFLEEHHTLRWLVGGDDVLNPALDSVQRPDDRELILQPLQANLAQYYQLCDKIPSHILRDSIIRRSANEQDRLFKLNNFQNTLASSTIFTWILGVGDRHLENILYSIEDGRLCHVDWGCGLQFGRGEVLPARLTRAIQGVADTLVLEALLQQLLGRLQQSRAPLMAVIDVCFKFMNEYNDKRQYIDSTLRGTTLHHLVVRDSIERSQMHDLIKTKHIELLDTVFEQFPSKDTYRIEEQVSCLLRACSDPRLLSNTRSGWEPWV